MPTICMNFRVFLQFRVSDPGDGNVRCSSQLQVTIFFITGDLFLPIIFKNWVYWDFGGVSACLAGYKKQQLAILCERVMVALCGSGFRMCCERSVGGRTFRHVNSYESCSRASRICLPKRRTPRRKFHVLIKRRLTL